MSNFAWVTLTTNDVYSLGALVLAHSLKRVGTVHQLAVLVTPTVSEAMRSRLREVYNVVQEVNILDSHDAANLALLSRPELGVTFTKLHAWKLTQFEKCVFLDSDILVLQNADELFEREELSAAPDVSWPDCFNSGVFVYRPNEETFASIIDFALKNGSFDGGDQGLLNLYFSDWATKDISKHLPFTYNTTAFASYSYLPAFKQFRDKIKILHFAGKLKPWLLNFNSETKQAHIPSEFQHATDLVQLWWTIFCDNVHQSLSDQMPFQDPWEDYYENLEKLKNSSNNNATTATTITSTNNSPTSQIDSNSNFVPSVPSEPSEPSVPSVTMDESNSHHNTHQQNQSVPQSEDFHNDNKMQQITTNFTENLAQSHDNLNNNTNENNNRISYIETMNEPKQVLNATQLDNNEPDNSTNKDTSNLDSNSILKSKNQDTLIVEKTHSDKKLSASEAGLAGALAHVRLGEPRSSEQEAYEASMRRQCWEAGNIDYSGRDSFDNIWKKISQTLDSKPVPSKPADDISNIISPSQIKQQNALTISRPTHTSAPSTPARHKGRKYK